ncbi:MAG: sensor histidine kinase, partial [Caulobacteraceae bacterium]
GLILENGRSLLAMIQGVLDLAGAEDAELILDLEPVDVAELIEQIDVGSRMAAERAGLIYASKVEPGLAPVLAEPRRLRRMLEALLGNAIKFNRGGGRVTLSARSDDEGRLLLQVEDSGIGMAPETITHALKPFGQADRRLARRYSGAGVGLPLTRRLAALQGAELEIESREGEGTLATLRFPAHRADDSTAVEPRAASAGSG